jgi:VRR-NUC domain
MTRQHPEYQIQAALAEHLRLRARPGTWWSATNNNPRSAIAGAIGKAAGIRAGLPDLLLVKSGRVFGLELKRPGGRVSPAQRATIRPPCSATRSKMRSAIISSAPCVPRAANDKPPPGGFPGNQRNWRKTHEQYRK